ncbi:hypothetical protein GPECTOR_97g747 [Gonium pectorale]|uniref:Uncharacterized protein n=1 Tax=Gonium pectorale TaxID=33097 RepID=A0A150G034_GONPE|nr:hypothetical protein GPECTOR_97g747 [Gonium pectorale]|eukprot:KXZ43209.1 hypothetical protein GPECTOR_97g747 [Gonium pectorale]
MVASGNGLVYTFGGRTGSAPADVLGSNSVEEYDPRSRALRSQVLLDWQNVPGRAGHAMVEWTDTGNRRHIVVYGGSAKSTADSSSSTANSSSAELLLSDVASFSLQTFKWLQHNDTGPGPSPRKYARAAIWGSNIMLVYGGLLADGTASSELWSYNLTARKWIGAVAPNVTLGDSPPALRSAALTVCGDFLLLYGGYLANIVSVPAPSPPPSRPSLVIKGDLFGPSAGGSGTGVLSFVLSKALYAVDLRALPAAATWIRAELVEAATGSPAGATHMAGLDVSAAYDERSDLLTIYSSGAGKP